jgi:hypothetical protein
VSAGIASGDCSEAYNEGTVVTLTASAAGGSTFVGWAGACSGVGGCQVTIDADTSVTAHFDVLRVSVAASVDPTSYSGPCPFWFNFTAEITARQPDTVFYYWRRSDNATAPLESVIFDAPGTQSVTDSWQLGLTGDYWERVEIVSPIHIFSNRAEFTLACDPAQALVWATISGGGSHNCALTTSGEAYCWGYNHNGQLGDGTREHKLVPTSVSSVPGFVSMSVGF